MIDSVRKLLSGSGLRAQLLRGGMGSMAVKTLGTLIGFAVAVVLARTLGPDGYGIYAFTLTVVTLLGIPAKAGLPALVTRETAKARHEEDWALMRGLWRWSTRLVVVFSFVISGLLVIGLLLADEAIDPARQGALIIAAGLIPLLALGNLRGAALRGLRKVVLGQLPELVLRPAILLVLMLGLLVFGYWRAPTAELAMLVYVIAAAVAFVIGAWLLRLYRPKGVKTETGYRFESAYWLRAVIPLALISGVQLLNTHIDMLLVGLMLTDAEVGFYRVAVQLASLVIFGLAAINLVLHPYIAGLYAERDFQKLQALATNSARAILLFALPPVFVFVFFGEWALRVIFGDDYTAASLALAILCLGQLVNAAMGSVGALLNMTGHERDTMRGMAIALGINIVLNLVLIPLFGIAGAAAATAASFVVWNILLWRSVWVRLGIRSTALKWI